MPDYSVIIPAYNEEELLPQTITALQGAMAQQSLMGEIILVDNNSTDQTAAIARQAGLQCVFEPINQISRARNRGAEVAQGRFLIFLDADTLCDPAILKEALEAMEQGRLIGGGVLLDFGQPAPLGVKFWNWLSRTFHLAAGGFFFVTKETFEQAGRFSHQVYASEEIWLSLRLKRLGKRQGKPFRILKDHAIHTSNRKFEWYGPKSYGLMFLLVCLFPFMLRYPRLLPLWYKRPKP